MKTTLRLFCLACAMLFCLTACGRAQFDPFEDVPTDTRGQTRLEVTQIHEEYPFVRMSFLLKDAFGNPLSGKTLRCAFGDDSAEFLTDENGSAELIPTFGPGSYDVIVDYDGDDQYRACTSRNTLQIKERVNRSGIYVRANEMRSADLDEFSENKIGHIFLHEDALDLYGTQAVEQFIADAGERGIKVHIWVLGLFDEGKWVNPIIPSTGEYNTEYFEKKTERVTEIASLAGLYGIHYDCIRFEGGENSRADRYTRGGEPAGEKAVTAFVDSLRKASRAVNTQLVLSGTLMPDPEEAVARYGQDVAVLANCFSFFVPMTYVGVYLNDVDEIRADCAAFASRAGNSEIWAGIVGYDGDETQMPLEPDAVRSYADAAYAGEAMGVVLFRFGRADLGANRGQALCPLIDLEPHGI